MATLDDLDRGQAGYILSGHLCRVGKTPMLAAATSCYLDLDAAKRAALQANARVGSDYQEVLRIERLSDGTIVCQLPMLGRSIPENPHTRLKVTVKLKDGDRVRGHVPRDYH